MSVPLVSVNRIAIFVHPGQLKQGVVHLITLHDADKEYFDESLAVWQQSGAICLYDGPPIPPNNSERK